MSEDEERSERICLAADAALAAITALIPEDEQGGAWMSYVLSTAAAKFVYHSDGNADEFLRWFAKDVRRMLKAMEEVIAEWPAN